MRPISRSAFRPRAGVLFALAALVILSLPATAFAQATRTWVSGTGDDANPCSRTAPCKTFAGAYSRTAVGGEIDALDSGGFGTIVIGHSLTISGADADASVLNASTDGITINAGAGDTVILEDLNVDGIDNSSFPGLSGIKVLSAGKVTVENSNIFGQSVAGINFQPANANSKLVLANSTVHDNGVGVLSSPQAGGSGSVFISNDDVTNNATGLQEGNGGGIVWVGGNQVFANTTDGSPTSYTDQNTGPQGPSGPPGPTGLAGRGGAAGQVELVSCHTVTRTVTTGRKHHRKKHKVKVNKCTGKLVSGPVKFTTTGAIAARATLSRAAQSYATGSGTFGGGDAKLLMTLRRALPAGSYTLTLSRGHRTVSRQTVLVR